MVELLEIVDDPETGVSTFAPLTEGSEVHLQRPIQGGHVIYVGARVTGLCADSVVVTGRVRDAETQRVIAKETRRGFSLADRGDGTAQPADGALGEVANIALCPELTGETPIRGTRFTLEVEVGDTEGRTASASIHVVPTCGQAVGSPERATCECECAAGAEAGGCG